jgi:hypothetical protein
MYKPISLTIKNFTPFKFVSHSTSRFCNPDNHIDAGTQGLNKYSYAHKNPLKYTDPTGWWNSGGGSDKAQAINDLASKLSRESYERTEATYSHMYVQEMLNINEVPTKEQLYQNLITEFPSIVLNDNLSYRINVTSYKVYDGLGSRTITTPECSDIYLSTLRHSEIWPTYTRIYEVQYRSKGGGWGLSLSEANGLLGAGLAALENFTLAGQGNYLTSKGFTKAINFAKLTLHSLPYAKAAKLIKNSGIGTGIASVGLDSYSWWNNKISGVHLGVNAGVTAWGMGLGYLGLGIPALIAGTAYFITDTYYNSGGGGFNGALNMNSNLIEYNQKILGRRFNLYRDY